MLPPGLQTQNGAGASSLSASSSGPTPANILSIIDSYHPFASEQVVGIAFGEPGVGKTSLMNTLSSAKNNRVVKPGVVRKANAGHTTVSFTSHKIGEKFVMKDIWGWSEETKAGYDRGEWGQALRGQLQEGRSKEVYSATPSSSSDYINNNKIDFVLFTLDATNSVEKIESTLNAMLPYITEAVLEPHVAYIGFVLTKCDQLVKDVKKRQPQEALGLMDGDDKVQNIKMVIMDVVEKLLADLPGGGNAAAKYEHRIRVPDNIHAICSYNFLDNTVYPVVNECMKELLVKIYQGIMQADKVHASASTAGTPRWPKRDIFVGEQQIMVATSLK